jgi:6-pyruvoyltetrahydropterin/6-carboxytetrahydropterin synthase
MFRITKEFSFSASHVLAGLPEGHPCGRLHGHNYRVEVVLEGEVDGIGFVLDYNALAPLADHLKARFDHRHLNDVLAPLNPTAEHLAYYLYHWIAGAFPDWPLAEVRVSETAKTWASYRPDGPDGMEVPGD